MYHVELRQFPHVARAFNLGPEEVHTRFVAPWVAGTMIEHEDRRWAPERTRLTILEGPELRRDELGLGRGWATATKQGADVTDGLIAAARRAAAARPELEALKLAIEEVAVTPIGLPDVMALAGAAHPGRRPSEQLALAEQAVWEMLHQHRLTLTTGGEPAEPPRWQPILLSWAAWTGDHADVIRVSVPPSGDA